MTNRLYNGGEWTSARFNNFIRSALRSASIRWGPTNKARKAAEMGRKINERTGRLAMHYLCNHCQGSFVARDVQVDHISPVVSAIDGFVDWNTYIDRMFCEQDGYQVLCKECHNKKTAEERGQRSGNVISD